jgi:hypothetical protein
MKNMAIIVLLAVCTSAIAAEGKDKNRKPAQAGTFICKATDDATSQKLTDSLNSDCDPDRHYEVMFRSAAGTPFYEYCCISK